jgi:hypothetical protein
MRLAPRYDEAELFDKEIASMLLAAGVGRVHVDSP